MTSQPPAPEDTATAIESAPSTALRPPAGSGQLSSDAPPTGNSRPPNDPRPTTREIGAGILGPDPMPSITDAEREEMSMGLLEITAEYQAECGAFTEEERARARAKLSSLG